MGLLTLWHHSEAERWRAEHALARALASDKATSSVVRDLVDLLKATTDAPQMLGSERFETSSRAVRELTAKLRLHQGFSTSCLLTICELERKLAQDFCRRGKSDEARELLMDSLNLLSEREHRDDEPEITVAYGTSLTELGQVARAQERFDEAVDMLQRGEDWLLGLVNPPHPLELILLIDESMRTRHAILTLRGQEETRPKRLEVNSRLIRRLNEKGGGDPEIGLIAALLTFDDNPNDDSCAALRAAIKKMPEGSPDSPKFRERVGYSIAYDVSSGFIGSDSDQGKVRPDPDTQAISILRAIRSRCEDLDVYPSLFPSAALEVASIAAERGAVQRKAGRLNDARGTAAFLLAFGEFLIQKEPNEPINHLILSTAYEQECKNAWKIEDYATIVETLTKALGEGHVALSLEPENARTRVRIAGLQDKLVGLASIRHPGRLHHKSL